MPAQEAEYVSYNGKGIGEYRESEPWENYCERLGGHFRSCRIAHANQQRDVLISTVGADTYGLVKNLLGQEEPTAKSYQELVDLVKTHKNPTPPWHSERLKFLSRNRSSCTATAACDTAVDVHVDGVSAVLVDDVHPIG